MRLLVGLAILAALAACTPALSSQEQEAAYQDDLARLIRVSTTDRLQQKVAASYRERIAAILEAEPPAPKRAYRILDEEIERALDRMMNDLVTGLKPIYAARFDHAEVKRLLAFYRSDLGRKALEVSDEMAAEGRDVIKDWNRDFGTVLFNLLEARLEEEGIRL